MLVLLKPKSTVVWGRVEIKVLLKAERKEMGLFARLSETYCDLHRGCLDFLFVMLAGYCLLDV